jgi:hypothetical protein
MPPAALNGIRRGPPITAWLYAKYNTTNGSAPSRIEPAMRMISWRPTTSA